MNRKVLFRLSLNSLLGLVLIFIWLKIVNLPETFGHLLNVKLEFVIVFVIFFIISTIIRSLRLKLLLKAYSFPLSDLVALNFLSQFLSFLIPIRAGEIVKGVYLSGLQIANQAPSKIPKDKILSPTATLAKSLIWIFLDRFLDFWGVLLLAAVTLLLIPTFLPKISFWLILAVFLSFSFSAWLILFFQSLAYRIFSFACKLIPLKRLQYRFLNFGNSIIDGFSVLRRPLNEVIGLLGLTILALLSDSLIILSVFLGLGMGANLYQAILANSLFGLTFLIPSAPGYVGSAEAYGSAVFIAIFGQSNGLSTAAALLFHILMLIVFPIFGLFSLYFLKIDLKLVWKRLKRTKVLD